MKNSAVIVQARMSSSRLPGKVLKIVAGKPILQHVLDRVIQNKFIPHVIVATSAAKEDDAIQALCGACKIDCARGPLEDVALRFSNVVRQFSLKSFVRVCADSPLLDPTLIDTAAGIFQKGEFQIVTNALKRTFPKGQTVEMVDGKLFLSEYPNMQSVDEREHVTKYFYHHAERFRIHNFTSGGSFSTVNLCVDTPEDLAIFEGLTRRLPVESSGWQNCMQLLGAAS